MFRKITHKFLLYLTMFVAILLLLAASVRWAPGASAQGLVEYAIILAFVPEADCSVNGNEVSATDSPRVDSLRVRGMRAREEGNNEIYIRGVAFNLTVPGYGIVYFDSGLGVFYIEERKARHKPQIGARDFLNPPGSARCNRWQLPPTHAQSDRGRYLRQQPGSFKSYFRMIDSRVGLLSSKVHQFSPGQPGSGLRRGICPDEFQGNLRAQIREDLQGGWSISQQHRP